MENEKMIQVPVSVLDAILRNTEILRQGMNSMQQELREIKSVVPGEKETLVGKEIREYLSRRLGGYSEGWWKKSKFTVRDKRGMPIVKKINARKCVAQLADLDLYIQNRIEIPGQKAFNKSWLINTNS